MSKRLKSDLGWSTADRIVVRGCDLVEDLIGMFRWATSPFWS